MQTKQRDADGGTVAAAAGDAAATPMMRQYMEIKAANADSLLFYRMGDFYELFFDDAVAASAALGITLTKRGKHLGEDIPMCGVPVVSADDYLQKLIAAGFRVAVCEQMEDPAEAKKRGSKSVVRRDVVRLVTPGTLTEEALLEPRANNYLVAVARVRGEGDDEAGAVGLAWADISTGECAVLQTAASALAAELARLEPGEILVPEQLERDGDFTAVWQPYARRITALAAPMFESSSAAARLKDYYRVATLDGFGAFTRAELASLGALVAYVERTQIGERPPLSPPSRSEAGATMSIDAATRANLEMTRTLSGSRKGSLLAAVDRTVTAAGARRLAAWLTAPLTDVSRIAARHDAVEVLVDDIQLCTRCTAALRACPDIARARARLALDRGGPRDLAGIRDGIDAAGELSAMLVQALGDDMPRRLRDVVTAGGGIDTDLHDLLAAALVDEPPVQRRDGNFVRAGFRADLDDARSLRDEGRRFIAALESRYREETGIRALKIRHNGFLGYYVEVPAQHGERMIEAGGDTFIHRQSLPAARRFTTAELADLQARIDAAAGDVERIEAEVFAQVCRAVLAQSDPLSALADALAALDVLAGFAALAAERAYCRPQLEEGTAFDIRAGRHAVVEQSLAASGQGTFVSNDCDLGAPAGTADGGTADAGAIWLVTGPNMAGKSTFLRQNALIVILAQAGSFVPAQSARIGIVDRLFSRVGAADDIARGRSTFMVEMVETAAILNQAGERSLVILDEIGRGTATFDGLSIAWAVLEHLHQVNRCRALFATHFHELAALSSTLPRLKPATLKVREWHGDVVFMHEVVPGAADRSYGVQVARLAGLPDAVIGRAKTVLAELEAAERGADPHRLVADLPLFSATPAPRTAHAPDPVSVAVAESDPDCMSPREALDFLYRLKDLSHAAIQPASRTGKR
ncbi:MAG: DNA mismatch repair protein MutS [Rhodobiaceae bacterium]|nr:DNA mismatch repair protein MutS [Rhodobiaceae bacterium]MCC0042312.1 DNA mismatch repair protein MutS [Rhodobiaceae bacterium]